MDNWNLFANGKFFHKGLHGIRRIIGYTNDHDGRIEKFHFDTGTWSVVHQCTLIARPIEDMSDEEISKLDGLGLSSRYPLTAKKKLIKLANNGELLFKQADHLLSMGIYPGPQSHFGDTVINVNSLEEA